MEKWFTASPVSLMAISLTALVVYLVLILLTRMAGKRSFSKMSSFDFAITVAIGSLLATIIISSSVSLLQGMVALAVVFALQFMAAVLRRFSWFQSLVDNKPLLLMDGSNVLHHNMRKAKVTESDLFSKLREANVIRLNEVRAVVFETTGDISVLHSTDNEKKLEDLLLKGVQH